MELPRAPRAISAPPVGLAADHGRVDLAAHAEQVGAGRLRLARVGQQVGLVAREPRAPVVLAPSSRCGCGSRNCPLVREPCASIALCEERAAARDLVAARGRMRRSSPASARTPRISRCGFTMTRGPRRGRRATSPRRSRRPKCRSGRRRRPGSSRPRCSGSQVWIDTQVDAQRGEAPERGGRRRPRAPRSSTTTRRDGRPGRGAARARGEASRRPRPRPSGAYLRHRRVRGRPRRRAARPRTDAARDGGSSASGRLECGPRVPTPTAPRASGSASRRRASRAGRAAEQPGAERRVVAAAAREQRLAARARSAGRRGKPALAAPRGRRAGARRAGAASAPTGGARRRTAARSVSASTAAGAGGRCAAATASAAETAATSDRRHDPLRLGNPGR